MRILRETDAVRAFQLNGADSPREYVVAVSSGSQVNAATSMRVQVRAASSASSSQSEALSPRPAQAFETPELERLRRASAGELRLREATLRELQRIGARPVRAGPGEAHRLAPSFSVAGRGTVPQQGDTLRFRLGVQTLSTVDCNATEIRIVGVVRALGERFALVEDTAVARFTTDAFYGGLIPELDGKVFPADSAYFGTPADIDGNERVIVLFTKEVNELTPPGSGTFIAGFFWPGDLADPSRPTSEGGCPASNEAEILYILAPDPDGLFGDAVSLQFARRNARGVVAHEFQHLILAQERVTKGVGDFNSLEVTWLSEALAHIAEEVSGLHVEGFPVRDNLRLSQAITSNATFETFVSFHLSNFLRLARFFEDPQSTQALPGDDPGGEASLRMRGFAWIFLRWLGDHFGPDGPPGIVPGSGEEALFRALTRGGPANNLKGVANILNALQVVGESSSWDDLVAEFASMPGVEENGPPGVPEVTQLLTWDLRDVFLDLHEERTIPFEGNPFPEPFPLLITPVSLSATTDGTFSFSLRGGAQRYFLLSGDAPPDVVVEVTDPSGEPVLAGARAQVTVVRIR